MLNKHRLFSISSIAVLLACGFACAQETPKDSNSKIADATKTETKKTEVTTTTTTTPANTETQKPTETVSPQDITKASEAFGHFIGRNLKAPGVNFDIESIIKGMREGAAGKPAPMSDKDYEELMARIQEQAYTQLAAENLKKANEFMDTNAKTAKIVIVEPGKLQYIIEKEGQGAVVPEHGNPEIQYTGKYLDGTTFGSSADAGGPISLPLDQTIPGVAKGIAGMKEGEKRKIFIHPDLGYGTAGQLPPNSLLIFEVEVVKATAPEKAKEAANELTEFSLDDLADLDDALDEELFEGDVVEANIAPGTTAAGITAPQAPAPKK